MDFLRTSAGFTRMPLLLLLFLALPALAQDEATPAPESDSGIGVKVAEVCLKVEERQSVGTAERFASDVGSLACFSRITGGEGQTVVHAWIHEGTTRARVELQVGSDSWRTWSTKQILPSWTGSWEVKIMTPEGQVLHTVAFTIY